VSRIPRESLCGASWRQELALLQPVVQSTTVTAHVPDGIRSVPRYRGDCGSRAVWRRSGSPRPRIPICGF
jgi:hypothetical protein